MEKLWLFFGKNLSESELIKFYPKQTSNLKQLNMEVRKISV